MQGHRSGVRVYPLLSAQRKNHEKNCLMNVLVGIE